MLQISITECMLCLTEISNCVLMDCGHSSICFDCVMRLAIKSRSSGKPPYCHLCRKVIKFALKIEVPEERLKHKFIVTDSPDNEKSLKKAPPTIQKKDKLVKIISYVDMQEALPRSGMRRRLLPKFKENMISDNTKWLIENADFTGLMNEFRFNEKTSKT